MSVSHPCQWGAALRPLWGYCLDTSLYSEVLCFASSGSRVSIAGTFTFFSNFVTLCGANWQRRSRRGKGKSLAWLGCSLGLARGNLPSSEHSLGSPVSCTVPRQSVGGRREPPPLSARIPPNRVHAVWRLLVRDLISRSDRDLETFPPCLLAGITCTLPAGKLAPVVQPGSCRLTHGRLTSMGMRKRRRDPGWELRPFTRPGFLFLGLMPRWGIQRQGRFSLSLFSFPAKPRNPWRDTS